MLISFWHVLVQLAPWLLLGTVIAGLLHVLLPKGLIHRQFRGSRGVFHAVVLGVPLPLCSCGVIPTGIGLKRDGASDGAAVGFLISTPQTGVDAILVSASFLGWPFALFKVVGAGITGIIGGLLAERVSGTQVAVPAEAVAGVVRSPNWLVSALEHGMEVVRSVWIWLLVGVVVSAAIETFVPNSFFEGLRQWGTLPASLAALLISLPLYVCATASVPIAGALVANGMPVGAALVFLMAGPATNVATMGAIYRAFGRQVLVIYLSTIIIGSLGFAVAFEWLLPGQVEAAATAFHTHATGWFAQVSAAFLLLLFAVFAVQDARRLLSRRRSKTLAGEPGIRVEVRGMSCNNCVDKLESALRSTEGVQSAQVQLDPGEAVVTGPIKEERLRARIRETGFEPGGMSISPAASAAARV